MNDGPGQPPAIHRPDAGTNSATGPGRDPNATATVAGLRRFYTVTSQTLHLSHYSDYIVQISASSFLLVVSADALQTLLQPTTGINIQTAG